MLFQYPELFGKAGVQSTNVSGPLQREIMLLPSVNLQLYVHLAKYEIPIIQIRNRWLVRTLISKNCDFRFRMSNEGHNWQNWAAQLPAMLQWFFRE